MKIKNITVIGAGTMGNGIAHVFAQYGYNVTLNDITKELIERGLKTIASNLDRQIKKGVLTEEQKTRILGNISTSGLLSEAVRSADLVIEAATENKKIKLDILGRLLLLHPLLRYLLRIPHQFQLQRLLQ